MEPPQCLDLLIEEFERDAGIELRVIETAAEQAAVPVVLDQPMIWVAWKGERVQPQSVYGRQLEKLEAFVRRGEMGEVVINDVVADEEISAAAIAVQGTKRSGEIATGMDQRFSSPPRVAAKANKRPVLGSISRSSDTHTPREARPSSVWISELSCKSHLAN